MVDIDGEQLDQPILAGDDLGEIVAPPDGRQTGEEADVAEVDSNGRHTAAEQATERAQDGAVAAEHQAHIGGAHAVLVDSLIAEFAGRRMLGKLVGRHRQLEAETLTRCGELAERRLARRREEMCENDDAAQTLRHERSPQPERQLAPGRRPLSPAASADRRSR